MKKNKIVIRSAVRKNKTVLSAALLSHTLGHSPSGSKQEPAEQSSAVLFGFAKKEPLCYAQSSVPKALGPSTSK